MRERYPRFLDALIWPAVILGDALILLCFIAGQFLVVQMFHGRQEDLAITGGAFGAVYVLVVHWGAWMGTRVGFKRMVVAGAVITIIAPLVLAQASGLWGVAAGTGLIGLGGGIMWPNVEAELARGRQGAALRKRFSFFNTMWCLGTLAGPLLSRWVYPVESVVGSAGGRQAVNAAFYWSSAMAVGVAVLMALWRTRIPPAGEVHAEHLSEAGRACNLLHAESAAESRPRVQQVSSPNDAPDEPPRDPARLRAFLLMSYVANLMCYVVLGVLRQLYEALANHQWKGREAAHIHAWMLVLLAGASCAMFAVLYFAHRWPYRIKRYVFWQAVMVCGLMAIATTGNIPLVAAGFILVGVATSFFYSGSLFYSIEGRAESKHMAGWHEMIIGLGNLAGLLLAGNVPALLGKMGVRDEEWLIRSPYLVVAGLFAAGAAVQLAIYARHRPRFAAEHDQVHDPGNPAGPPPPA